MESQMTFTAVDKQFPVPPEPIKKKEPEYKWLRVEVTKTRGTEVYLKVPKEFDNKKLYDFSMDRVLSDAINKTICSDVEWEDVDFVQCESIQEVSEKEANQYEVYEVKQ